MFSTRVLQEGLNGVKATSDKGQKILLTANRQRLKILTDNRQSNETLTVMRNFPAPPISDPLGTLPGKIHHQVDPESKPVVLPARKIPASVREKFKRNYTD